MYASLLFVHSWVRWLVLILLVVRIGVAAAGWMQGRPRSGLDKGIGIAAVSALDLQLLLGLALYATSPLLRVAMSDMGAAMKDAALRFWSVEHGPMMVLAVVMAHVAQAMSKKAKEDAKGHRIAAIGTTLALVVILISIPWPFRAAVGRALFAM